MSKANKRFDELEKQREERKAGKLNYIPFHHHFPKLAKHVPGFFKDAIFGILAGSGDGKTKMTKYLTIIVPYLLSKSHGLKFKTIYFALEESEEEFIDHLTILLLNERYNINIDYHEINSYRDTVLGDDIIQKIRSLADEIDDILSHVYIYDSISHPTGMFLKCKEHAEQWGKIVDGKYIPDDENEVILVVCDHVSLIRQEYDSKLKITLNKHQALAKWSTEYALGVLTRKFKWCVVNVQQTTMTSEGSEKKKLNSLEPSAEDLATNKELYRDLKVLLALYSPYKNKQAEYRGYTIATSNGGGLRDAFRNLGIIKNRYGQSGVNIGLHFDGATGKYTELDRENQQKYFKK